MASSQQSSHRGTDTGTSAVHSMPIPTTPTSSAGTSTVGDLADSFGHMTMTEGFPNLGQVIPHKLAVCFEPINLVSLGLEIHNFAKSNL